MKLIKEFVDRDFYTHLNPSTEMNDNNILLYKKFAFQIH